jgi:hypothetical protein
MSNSRKCPICRCTNYETKDYYKDKEYFVNKCVVLIQRYIRGFLLRYYIYKNIFRDNMPKNKHLRSIYSPWKIKELTSKMINEMEQRNKEVNVFIKEIEKDLKEFKVIDEDMINKKVITNWNQIMKGIKCRENENCAICFTSMVNKRVVITSCTHCFHKNCLESFEKFDHVIEKRCPICRASYAKKETIYN